MSDPNPGMNLSDPPRSEEKGKEELEDERDSLGAAPGSFVSENNEAISETQTALDEISMSEFVSSDLQTAQSRIVVDSGQALSGDTSEELTSLDNMLEVVADRVNGGGGGDGGGPDVTARQQHNTQKWIAIAGLIAAGVGLLAAMYAIIKDAISGSSSADNPLSEETQKKVRALVAKWWGQQDSKFWGDLATVADSGSVPLTIADQILFMNYVIDLSITNPWIWQSADDITAIVRRLTDAYAAAGSRTSAMYREVVSVTYQGSALPRPVSATVLRYALARILILQGG